jgi:hypothetical protein
MRVELQVLQIRHCSSMLIWFLFLAAKRQIGFRVETHFAQAQKAFLAE